MDDSQKMAGGSKATAALSAIPILLGLLLIVIGVFVAGGNPGLGLIVIGAGFGLVGAGGSLVYRGPGLYISGAASFVLIALGAVLMTLPRP